MTFTAIVCSHAFEQGLRNILGCLQYQIHPPDQTIVMCSDTPDLARLREDFPWAEFHEQENREDWGHEKRARGLDLATMDFVGWFNDDSNYSSRYIDRLLNTVDQFNMDVAYCDWTYIPNCHFGLGSSDCGNFIVRTDLAQKVGWTGRHYEADGEFIDRVGDATDRVVKVNECLYFHNALQR